ncbi:thiamine pyrophosphate-dependent enzyme [Occallatibacter savannae]|uniref:thiamine pyrophosphate-dependent enzyme n=1 Tax=Occallatibacter savannae TaxID=1002691 RepID=UPI000D68A2DE|nr:thiamine pyrophosphate-dependent enzyme [Occallatibacter savannae]
MPKKQTKPDKTSEKPFSLIPGEKLLAIYSAMLKCRLLEQRATALFQQGKLDSDLHLSSGREATAAASVIDLERTDTLCLAPHDWLPAFVKGMSLETLFRALAPSRLQGDGPLRIEAEHKNVFDGSSDLQQVLLDQADAAFTDKKSAVAAAFIPAGGASLNEWKRTIETAGSRKLPAIFIHYTESAEDTPTARSAKPEALVHGVPSIAVDARDPVAVYRVAYEAIVRARQLRGATLISCMIDSPVSTPNNGGSQAPEPIALDPVAAMEAYLKSKKIEHEVHNREVIEAFNRDLDLATRFLDK